jgi:hypothetical protein
MDDTDTVSLETMALTLNPPEIRIAQLRVVEDTPVTEDRDMEGHLTLPLRLQVDMVRVGANGLR